MRIFVFRVLCRGDASLGPRELAGDWWRSDDLDTQRLQPPRVAGVDHDRSMARAARRGHRSARGDTSESSQLAELSRGELT